MGERNKDIKKRARTVRNNNNDVWRNDRKREQGVISTTFIRKDTFETKLSCQIERHDWILIISFILPNKKKIVN